MDISIFLAEFSEYLCCKKCGNDVEIFESQKLGLSSAFSINCASCDELSSFKSCNVVGEKNTPEINSRLIYAMRCIGNGWAGMNTFCSIMDLPKPVEKATYTKITREISSGVSQVADFSMEKAAENEICITGLSKITVSGDGSWKTRGHNSQIGMTTIIGAETGKVIDIEVMSSFCKGCSQWKNAKSGPEYDEWQNKHKKTCMKNHTGSAGKMEADGMLKMFQRSEQKNGAQYINYIGDGDTKTFYELQKSQVYGPEVQVAKIECVGHVQKRMGTRLRQLKKNMRGKKLEDGKTLCGKGRLTDKIIDEFSVYYGNAIRGNKDSLMGMRKAVWAIFFITNVRVTMSHFMISVHKEKTRGANIKKLKLWEKKISFTTRIICQ
jgi:hypothetical protein